MHFLAMDRQRVGPRPNSVLIFTRTRLFLNLVGSAGHVPYLVRLTRYGYLPYTNCGDYRMRQTVPRLRKQPPVKTYRFDARLNEEQKLLIQRAADLEGRTMTDFVLHSAESAAERTIEKRAMLILTARETEAFADAILNPPEPGPVLRQAARAYRDKTASR
jgi:uncharacterized protein (DUF1778 family)